MHPLIDDLSTFTDRELQEKFVELQKKYFSTYNAGVQSQIALVIDTFNLELEKRYKNKKTEKKNNDLDNLINVS